MGDKTIERENKVFKIVPITVVLVVFIYYFFGWNILAWFNKDKTAYDMVELTRLVNDSLEQGKNEATYYVTGVSEEDIVNINDYICGLNGAVSQYSILEKSRNGLRIKFKFKISDNYYVLQKYLNDFPIPDDKLIAKKLYDCVIQTLDAIIKPGMTDYEKELAIHDYIVSKCEYGFDEYAPEYAYRAYGVLSQNIAVCNGYAEAMALLLTCVNIDNEIVTGMAGGELHAWNQVKIDGKWYQVDATWDDPLPDRGNFAGHQFFNVDDDILDDTHEWKIEDYNVCDSMDNNYFLLNNLIGDISKLKSVVRNECIGNINKPVEMVITDYSGNEKDLEVLFDIPGVMSYKSSVEGFGENKLVTIYIN